MSQTSEPAGDRKKPARLRESQIAFVPSVSFAFTPTEKDTNVHRNKKEGSKVRFGRQSGDSTSATPMAPTHIGRRNKKLEEVAAIRARANQIRMSVATAHERFRHAVMQVMTINRLEGVCGKKTKYVIAPFSIVSPYQHTRRLLDQKKHAHLLGEESGKGGQQSSIAQRKASVSPFGKKPVNPVRQGDSSDDISDTDDVAGSRGSGERLPAGVEVALLPPEMAQTLRGVASDKLRTLFYPRVVLRQKLKKKRIATAQILKHTTRPSGEYLKKRGGVFQDWPLEVLNDVSARLFFFLVESNEIALFEGEPPSVLAILTQGACTLERKISRRTKQLSSSNTVIVANVRDPAMFNEFGFLTEEPRRFYVRTTTRCEFWGINHQGFSECHAQLPAEVRAALAEKAFHKRIAAIPISYPMVPQLMRQTPLFARSSNEVLEALIEKLEPMATPAGHEFVQRGQPCGQMYFIRRGKVGQFRVIGGENLHIATHIAPCALLTAEAVHHRTSADTFESLSDCDLYYLTMANFDTVVMQFPAEREIIMAVAREQHMAHVSLQQVKFRPLIYSIPLVRTLLKTEQINAMSYLFEGRMYPPLSIVCSASDMCDRIIILVKGAITIGRKFKWDVGDAAGYTCLIPHRWAHAAVAMEPSECIELPRKVFIAFLKDCHLLFDALFITRTLLFPKHGTVAPDDEQEVEGPPQKPYHDKLLESLLAQANAELEDDEKKDHVVVAVVPSATINQHEGAGGAVGELKLGGIPSSHALQRVKKHIERLCTPIMFPVSDATQANNVSAGFVKIRTLDSFGPDAFVAPGRVSSLPPKEKEAIVEHVGATFKAENKRKLTHVTKFLFVKQKVAK